MASCFVIMPFGQKKDAQGKPIDFDKVYQDLIKQPIADLGLECIRCDEIEEPGLIHAKMIEKIYHSEVAVVDITLLNPNVFYELGVRHALVDFVTVLIKRRGTKIPFNIQGLNAIEYDYPPQENMDATKAKIVSFVRNGLAQAKVDSLVHQMLSLRVSEEAKVLTHTDVLRYKLPETSKMINIITGDILGVKCADVWVSSENTNMQMSRFYERSISGVVRYHGAERKAGQVVDDIIAKDLAAIVGENANVPAGHVIATTAGELQRTHNVKRIFHAAAVIGQVGKGFSPIQDVASCVRNALDLADSDELRDVGLRSILFPMIGTGQGRGKVVETAHKLIEAAIAYLRAHKRSRVEEVFFLTWSDKELAACKRAFAAAGLQPVGGKKKNARAGTLPSRADTDSRRRHNGQPDLADGAKRSDAP
jgi:O-acetyl-ADP-ribose deacetylase (regulator of RNase III)